jgi:hypothetical protein
LGAADYSAQLLHAAKAVGVSWRPFCGELAAILAGTTSRPAHLARSLSRAEVT